MQKGGNGGIDEQMLQRLKKAEEEAARLRQELASVESERQVTLFIHFHLNHRKRYYVFDPSHASPSSNDTHAENAFTPPPRHPPAHVIDPPPYPNPIPPHPSTPTLLHQNELASRTPEAPTRRIDGDGLRRETLFMGGDVRSENWLSEKFTGGGPSEADQMDGLTPEEEKVRGRWGMGEGERWGRGGDG